MAKAAAGLLGLLLAGGIAAHAAATPKEKILDDFSRPDVWMASDTDDIGTSLRPINGRAGKALCLDFDFNGVPGGATLRRALPITFPANYALSFDVRGAMPPNDTCRSSNGQNVRYAACIRAAFPVSRATGRCSARMAARSIWR